MATFQFDGEVDLGPDDELLIVDDVRGRDIVYFDRTDDHEIVLRTLPEANLASFSGRAYRVGRGDPPYMFKFTQLK